MSEHEPTPTDLMHWWRVQQLLKEREDLMKAQQDLIAEVQEEDDED